MADTKYILRYLPLFYEELEEKVVYIAETLKNPQAANNLLEIHFLNPLNSLISRSHLLLHPKFLLVQFVVFKI